MESQEQAFFPADDGHLSYDANFCSLQSEVQMQFPATLEPSTLEGSVLQESEINMDDRQVKLSSNVARDGSNSVLENGRGPGNSDSDLNKMCIVSSGESKQMNEASAVDNTIRAGVCIGTIVSVHEQANTVLSRQSANEPDRAHKVQVSATSSKPENKIDYGESVALEDFGGEFEDGHGIEMSPFASVSVFTDNDVDKLDMVSAPSAETNVNDGDVAVQISTAEAAYAGPEEQPDVPESLDKILPKSPADEESVECEEEPPVLEREVDSKAGNSERNDEEEGDGDMEEVPLKSSSRRSRRHVEAVSGRKQASDNEHSSTSNLELNVNSRPRRSVNRKSVFELLHVDYRYVGGPKKVPAHRASEGEVNHEPPAKKPKSSNKKGNKVSREHAGDATETPVKMRSPLSVRRDHLHDIDNQLSALKKKVVAYKPDDFLVDGDVESEVTKNVDDKDKKSAVDADRSLLKESVFTEADDLAARSFLSTFAAESAEALSSFKQAGDVSNDLDALMAENQELRSRVKALEQSKSLMKKFNIDFHGRKFSRIRSPAVASPEQQKTPGKTGSLSDGTPAAERKAPVETGESVLSRIAVLNRREHKLRELTDELDERATSVKIAEGALRRRERRLVDFEKTLEHRERVLSRHEQSILKRELILGSPALPADDLAAEESEDRQSLAAEIQRRLEQRRLELDRRQAALSSERTRLEIREQELDQRAASSRMVGESSISIDEDKHGSAHTTNSSSSRPFKSLTSTGNRKRKALMSRFIGSKYLPPKKKVLI